MTKEQYLQNLLENAKTEEEVKLIEGILYDLKKLDQARRGFGAY